MENLALKTKLAVLWLVVELMGVVQMMLNTFEPGVIEQVIAGEIEGMQITPELLLVLAILFLIPLFMAFLSLTLKDSTNRWVNIILGIFFAGFSLIDLITERLAKPYYILMGIAVIVASALIVWHAWKWPKQEV